MPEPASITVNEQVTLEGEYARGQGDLAALVLHPHPLYGGSMRNNVVAALCRAAGEEGLAWLAINFRGVGGSTGGYDDGRGEVEDVLAAAAWLAGQGKSRLLILGYSFGSVVGLAAASRAPGLAGAVWVAPALVMGPLPSWRSPAPMLVICGDGDDFAPEDGVRDWFDKQGALGRFEVFEKGDHFYWGRESELCTHVKGFLRDYILGGEAQ